ncbi:MAG: ATP-grasp domain-containing protein [Candidatus Paceibacterota bacterium]
MTTRETVIYVTREIERALGMAPNEHYLIVTNRTAYGVKVRDQYPDFVTLIADQAGELLGTGDLLKHEQTEELVAKVAKASGAKPYILVFKNTARIEPLVRDHGWMLLNPSAASSEKIESKLSQIGWLAELGRYLPAHRMASMRHVPFEGKPFVIQWAHGHTGTGTILIESEEALKAVQAKFPERWTRVTEYIRGPSFTVNVIITPDRVAVGNVSYQITGLPPFTDNRFTTIGNDWGVARTLLTADDKSRLDEMVREIGAKMQKDYWRGLFGIDVIKDIDRNKLYLIEINARQAASSPFESSLQEEQRSKGAQGLTVFEAHIAALLGQPVVKPIIEIKEGAQIVQRVTKDVRSVPAEAAGGLELAGYNVVAYENTKEGSDLLRVQSAKDIMAADGAFNDKGKEISGIVSGRGL